MKRAALGFWRRLKAMPEPLCGFKLTLWAVGTFVMVSPFLPGWREAAASPAEVEELPFPLNELESPINKLAVVATGLGMITIGICIYKRWAWVRHALFLGIAVITLSGFVRYAPALRYEPIPTSGLIIFSAIIIIWSAHYLYFRREVISYFTQNPGKAE